ncbi:MAG: ATPase domain-containing protein [Candidatus Altiarchaeota archaeon]
MDRVSTGIAGLDRVIEGGIPRGRSTLIKGVSGSGKTTMGLMFLAQGASENQKGAYFTLEQGSSEIISENLRLLPNLKEHVESGLISFFDRSIPNDILCKPDVKALFDDAKAHGNPRGKSDIKDPKQFEKFIDSMFRQMSREGHTRLVIDSLNSLGRKNRLMLKSLNQRYDPEDHYELVLNIIQKAKALGITTYLLSEVSSLTASCESYESFLADGIVELDINDAMHIRVVRIRKMRATNHTLKPYMFEFVEGRGIEVNPTRVL